MTTEFQAELGQLMNKYFRFALSHLKQNSELSESLKAELVKLHINEEAEVPGINPNSIKFGKFINREFVIMMTDIRKSTDIIKGKNGLPNMFLIFYIYAGIVAKIVDSHKGTSTEFLGDGVLNMFDINDLGKDTALRNCALAAFDIMYAREYILNPFFLTKGIPTIDLGIGIDYGPTIVTSFGYRSDTDLKAFGTCAYIAAKLSKGVNIIDVSQNCKSVWPTSPGGKLMFSLPKLVNGQSSYSIKLIP
jgi:class 3 adenylate cyclase